MMGNGAPHPQDSKYIVLKRKDLQKLSEETPLSITKLDYIALDDATVIRGQDIFAAPALDMYANIIAISMTFGSFTEEQKRELSKTADYFERRANESRAIAYKLPDE